LGESKAAKAPAAPAQHRQWEIDADVLQRGAPAYPNASRSTEGQDFWNEGYQQFRAFWIEASQEGFRKQGVNPDDRVHLDLLAVLRGIEEARFQWLSARCKALEARLAEVEGHGIKFAGSYQRANSYERGAVVSFNGSAWVALKQAEAGMQPAGNHDIWQLLVKRGSDGRDAQ
ncbi:MAG: hypothetical protein E5Y89_03630, partial [Mesorhizobium sp.]